jgi:hypothetical protein
MAVAPLIKPITTKKGMFYAFQSAIEDLTLNFNNNTNKFKFSKFALLRIPEFGVTSSIETDNKFQFRAQGESPLVDGVSTNQNINLANSFQNYALNLESLLISQPTYKRENNLNVSERVFWKWLKESGAVRWRYSDSGEVVSTLPVGENRWSEDWFADQQTTYNRVVQYIGEIDVVNSVRSTSNAYSELYIHVPTSVGATPTVLFNSVADENYGPGMLIVNTPGDPFDLQYLNGRRYDDTHPYAGMTLKAIYDLDTNAIDMKLSDELYGVIAWPLITSPYPDVNDQGIGFWWGASSIGASYYTDQSAYFGGSGSTPKVQRIYKEYGALDVEYLRSTLDGVVVDFELSNYVLASADPKIKTFNQLNETYGHQDFDFNAILVYYDVYDPTLTTVEPVTNLYGVYFLNKLEQVGTYYEIPMITKNKPDPVNKINGNAYAFRLNVKLDNSIDEVAVEKSVNDYNTFSLNLFIDVLTEIRLLQTKFNDKLLELEQLSTDLNSAKDSLLNANMISSLNQRIGNLETTISASTEAFDNASAVMELIDSVNGRLDDVLAGNTSLSLKYNMSAFKQGYGVILDKRVNNEITIASNIQAYSAISTIDVSSNTLGIKTESLGIGGTMIRHTKVVPYTMTSDITLRIDDSINAWKTGQVLRLVFNSQVIPGSYSIHVKTDSLNITNAISEYNVNIVSLTAADFVTSYGRNGTPIIEIICTNPKTLSFVVDKIIR